VIENSEFANNETGFATGDLNNDDAPSPQDGACPGNAANPTIPKGIQRTHVSWVLKNNYIHDNNNPNVPNHGSQEPHRWAPPSRSTVAATTSSLAT
jgi:hypothetical protein